MAPMSTMKRVALHLSLILLLLQHDVLVSSFTAPRCTTTFSTVTIRGGASLPVRQRPHNKSKESDDDEELKDYSGSASALFGNIRIPAALFAGASAGAAFAMPLTMGSEGLKLGLVKRLYALIVMGALSSEILAVVISTLSVAALSTKKIPKTTSLAALIEQEYNFEWVAARLHFLSGVLLFVVGIGLRAWVTIGCPIIAKAALGIILSATMLCIAFVQELENTEFLGMNGLLRLPFRYFQLMFQRAWRKPLFAAAALLSIVTCGYTIGHIPHVWKFLAAAS